MAWELDAGRPIYAQLVERIQREIVSGQYRPGEKLPSVRDLATVAAESICRIGAEWSDRNTAHQRQNRDGGHRTDQEYQRTAGGRTCPEFYEQHAGTGISERRDQGFLR